MSSKAQWHEFSAEAHHSMIKFMNREFELDEACQFTDKHRESGKIDEEILMFVENVIVSIIPDYETFDRVLQMFKDKVSEEEFLRFMNSP